MQILLLSPPVQHINLARSLFVRAEENWSHTVHKAKATTPASPASTAPPLTILATAPPVEDAEAEAAVPDDDAVDDPAAVVLGAEEPDELPAAAEDDAAAAPEVELAPPPPETGLGVGLPAASSKFAHASRVRLWAWTTRLRLPKKELTPGSVDR